MKRVIDWLEKPWDFELRKVIICGFVVFLVSVAWSFTAIYIQEGVQPFLPPKSDREVKRLLKWLLLDFHPITILIASLIEEIYFRFLPIFFTNILIEFLEKSGKLQKNKTSKVLLVVLASSLLFGYSHFSFAGFSAFYIQGVLGLIWSVVFLKTLVAISPKLNKYVTATLLTWSIHIFYNLSLWLLTAIQVLIFLNPTAP